eukprot:scaffold35834_cov16-Tisochrysis_lutea.AAC.2
MQVASPSPIEAARIPPFSASLWKIPEPRLFRKAAMIEPGWQKTTFIAQRLSHWHTVLGKLVVPVLGTKPKAFRCFATFSSASLYA